MSQASNDNPLETSYSWWHWVSLVLILIVGFGVLGKVLGGSWFMYRPWRYGTGELYALNLSDKALWVSVDQRAPVEVSPQDARILRVLGGQAQVEVREKVDGPVIFTQGMMIDHSHALLKLASEGCLVAVDLDLYYGAAGKVSDDIKIVDKIHAQDRVWVPGSYNVVWPRKPFPKKLTQGQGPGRWIELVACSLLEDTEDNKKFLDAYMALRLQERVKRTLEPSKPTTIKHEL